MHAADEPYPPIADYALLSDCHCTALVGRSGSIDWCCMPRMDSESCFGRLLDWRKGGHFRIAPQAGDCRVTRDYRDATLILDTEFASDNAAVRVTDCFVMSDQPQLYGRYCLLRVVEGLRGRMPLAIDIQPRFDCGEIIPHVTDVGDGLYTAFGSNKGLVIQSDCPLDVRHTRELHARPTVAQGERIHLALRFEAPEALDGLAAALRAERLDVDTLLAQTQDWWHGWMAALAPARRGDRQIVRSALVVKALTFERTGAVIAAATSSLPEAIGGNRNWDYRYSWIRDSVFATRALYALGFSREASRFSRFIERSAAGSAEQLQLMYAVDGKRRLPELELDELEGWRGSRPVRLGNRAAQQTQLDSYGGLLELTWMAHDAAHDITPDYWDFLSESADVVCRRWREPDHGIWEFRSAAHHFVHSKAMCWAALHRAVGLAERRGCPVPLHWHENLHAIRDAVETRGYDPRRGIFIQAFERNYPDSALLLLPRFRFVDYRDPRMLRTVDAICAGLERDGLLLRYAVPDGLNGSEGAFLPCTFWLVECLAKQGRRERALVYYGRAMECANDLGLFAEEYAAALGEPLGNFPQVLTHVSQINARLALDEDTPPAEC